MGNIKKKEVGAKGRRNKKKKSERAATINMSSKRKLSRMGKEQQKGKSGMAAMFVSRNQALKKLSITLRDFRRLCILKGIHPRDPKIKNKGSTTTYYHAKDISFLAHEPLLQKFREFKVFMKKVRRMAAKKEFEDARNRYDDRPGYTLMHLVKERYPSFQSAVQDMDDALCMAHLFGQMKQHGSIGAERTRLCARFCREWQLIVVKTHALRKAFVTVKGYYYEAEVAGESVVWLVPHMFPHQKPKDVDVRIMSTFLEFYEVYLKFVLFKMYHDAGLAYPPVIEEDADNAGSFLAALTATSLAALPGPDSDGAAAAAAEGKARPLPADLQLTASSSSSSSGGADGADGADAARAGEELEEEFQGSTEAQQLQQLRVASRAFSELFRGLRFFISRECPRDSLEFVLRAFRGQVGWEGPGSPFSADDPNITHQVVDRPSVLGERVGSREYVQPQWVYDCINFKILLPVKRYTVGARLPPHLSPFTDDIKEGYVPAYREEVLALQVAKSVPEALEMRRKLDEIEAAKAAEAAEEEEEEALAATGGGGGAASKQEQRELAISMMSKKKRRLHDRIAYGQNQKSGRVAALEGRRKALESGDAAPSPAAVGGAAAAAALEAAKAKADADAEAPAKKKTRKKKKKTKTKK